MRFLLFNLIISKIINIRNDIKIINTIKYSKFISLYMKGIQNATLRHFTGNSVMYVDNFIIKKRDDDMD